MLELFRKTVLIGLGVADRAGEMLKTLAREGEESQSETAQWVRRIVKEAGKGAEDLEQKISGLAQSMISRMRLSTRADVERLEREIAELSARISRKEAKNV